MLKPTVSTILVNFKQTEKTLCCLQKLGEMSVKPDFIAVIDNQSDEVSKKLLQGASSSIPLALIFNEKNLGFAAACNQGIREALARQKDSFIWLLNNDTLPNPNALEKLLDKALETSAGITGSLIQSPNGDFSGGVGYIHPFFGSVRRPQSPEETGFNYVEGSSFLISPRCLSQVGLLSEDFFLYFEETDYCVRALKKGFSIAWATESIVLHDMGASTGGNLGLGKVPFFIDCLSVRNRIHFAKKNGYSIIGRNLGLFISLLIRAKRFQFRRIFKILHITLSTKALKKFIIKNGGYYEIEA
ncbi:MAG: glycosyltransferase family 2 protein [Fibrobacter sp.]|nr:glycosyltransferase family 2 protein [Fibrobacter sp.]